MKNVLLFLFIVLLSYQSNAQERLPDDLLSSDFHKERREAFRAKMPSNSVAIFFANPVRNRANDVDYIYHQDPDFYYLTGLKEPHSALVIYSEEQQNEAGESFDEIIYMQSRSPFMEQWTGRRLGAEGARDILGFDQASLTSDFMNTNLRLDKYDVVLHKPIVDDIRDQRYNKADLYALINKFKKDIGLGNPQTPTVENKVSKEIKIEQALPQPVVKTDDKKLGRYMAELRQIKLKEELKLLKKAIRISSQGQIEVMKAMHPAMSETEVQGIHEYVYKRYGSEYEGYPSIVGAGNNGCILHYTENNKMTVQNELVLMDLGAEYHGYTADVTRTIPANGKFTAEQKAIYDLVLKAQDAGINAARIGNGFRATDRAARQVIVKGLIDFGIAETADEANQYFPHGTSHYLGLDVHDPGTYGTYEASMVITVEPGIYIPEGSECDEKWHGIAVRIEDDILITENGPVNLSADAPRTTASIEQMMKQKSALDDFKLPKLD
ncbi:MAG: aminopeptidase P N-terminal domain-containing protein [Bacteroidia bacterium]|nr:aminopeptidase P N-terminal domain-containing protein [Bacteroidia bacterium]